MSTIAVTGVSGVLGQRLLLRLADDRSVDRVVGIDARDSAVSPAKLQLHRADVATADLKPLLHGVDALAHLAFLVAPHRDLRLMARINVDGTRRVLDAAGAAGVNTIVYMSSALVYGAWPTNPVPLTEDAPIKPNAGLAYAAHKAETERLASEWRDGHPGATLAVLRPVTVVGPGADNWVTRLVLDAARANGTRPPMQFVHADDVAAAIQLAINRRLDGVYNVAPDGWIAGDEARSLAGGRRVSLPSGLAARLDRSLAEARPWLEQPWVVANDRLKAAGWAPTHTNEEALVAGAPPSAWQSLNARRRQGLALGGAVAGLAGVTAGGVAVVRAARRRNARSRS
jgi:nucleoside-diphosphate-sugar epimerase